MIIRYVKGDITETELKYIAHGVSCTGKNSIVTNRIFSKYPNNKAHYAHIFREHLPENRIGISFGVSVVKKYYSIFTMFTQFNTGSDEEFDINCEAISKCFSHFRRDPPVGPLAIPKNGWGINDWTVVEQIINDVVGDTFDIWVYEE